MNKVALENILSLIDQKQYSVLREEMNSNFPDATPSELINEFPGMGYLIARFCRILTSIDEETVEVFENMNLDLPTIITIGKENPDLVQKVLDILRNEQDISMEQLSNRIIRYKEKVDQRDKLKEIDVFLSNFNMGSLMHIAAKADQFGVITPKNKGFLLQVAKFYVTKRAKKTMSEKQFKFAKDLTKKIYESEIASKGCGEQSKPCKLCLDAGKSLSNVFEKGVKNE